MVILNQMIRTGRFAEFVQEFIRIKNEELSVQTRWEFWLHRVFDMSFEDYLAKCDSIPETEETVPDEVLQATVQESMGIINDFCPS